MKMAIGLGNPGRQYEGSRHNLGFRVIDRLAERFGIARWKSQFEALQARGEAAGRGILLAKPQTFMNNSGRAVAGILRFYKVPPEDWVVIVDDLDLPVGKIRLRSNGSDGGHRGLQSIIEALGTQDFKRIRIGIGRPTEGQTVVGHVLSADPAEEEVLAQAVERAAEVTARFLETGQFENWSSP
jgi:PTH1 family peptidyl-tRNA hydrolase